MKVTNKTYQAVQLIGAICSIITALLAARSFVFDYTNWQGFLYLGLFFVLLLVVAYLQSKRSNLVTLRGREYVSSTDIVYEVFYEKPFKTTPHLQTYSFRASRWRGKLGRAVGGERDFDPTSLPGLAPFYVLLEQRPDGFRIQAHKWHGAWYFKWKAKGLSIK